MTEFKYPFGKLKERPVHIIKLLREMFPDYHPNSSKESKKWEYMLSDRYGIMLITVYDPSMEFWMILNYSEYIINRW